MAFQMQMSKERDAVESKMRRMAFLSSEVSVSFFQENRERRKSKSKAKITRKTVSLWWVLKCAWVDESHWGVQYMWGRSSGMALLYWYWRHLLSTELSEANTCGCVLEGGGRGIIWCVRAYLNICASPLTVSQPSGVMTVEGMATCHPP